MCFAMMWSCLRNVVLMSEILSFNEFKKKYQYIRTDEMICYELYLLLKKINKLIGEDKR